MNYDDIIAKLPNFLLELLNKQYGNDITEKIINGYTYKRPVTFRVNTLKSDIETIESELIKLKIEFTKATWSKEAFILHNITEKDIEQLDIYKEGKIYMQSLSSMLPPIILEPKADFDILDMAAAPGGKTTQIAALSQNKAHITACEMNPIRAERLKYNIDKQGASSIYCMVKDARNIDDFFSFDQILLDAPCSGSGILNICNNKLKENFTEKLIKKCVSSQISLIKKAINILKTGSEMVYSTCSILECENEEIINTALKTGRVEIVPIESNVFSEELPLLPAKIKGTIAIAPDKLYEGFFVAKLKKIK